MKVNIEFKGREIGLIWEALTEYAARSSKEKAQELLKLIKKIEKLHGDNT